MEAVEKFEQWVVIPLSVEPSEVVNIEHFMPANAKLCTGVAITLSDVEGYYLPNIFGEFAILLNERRAHPLNFQAEWRTERFRIDYLLQRIEEPLLGGAKISGFYSNLIPIAYSVKIYLQCISERKM